MSACVCVYVCDIINSSVCQMQMAIHKHDQQSGEYHQHVANSPVYFVCGFFFHTNDVFVLIVCVAAVMVVCGGGVFNQDELARSRN